MFGEVVLQVQLKGLDATGAGVAPEAGVPDFPGLSPGLGLEMSSLAHQEEARLPGSSAGKGPPILKTLAIRRHWGVGEVWAEPGPCCYLCGASWEKP